MKLGGTMKNKISYIGIIILVCLFIGFYFITTIILDNVKGDNKIENEDNAISEIDINYMKEKAIVDGLYQNVRMLYDVVNSKFKVDQEDTIIMNDIIYKKITNFNDVTGKLFTENGLNKYIKDLGSYFAITSDKYYLAGNLVSYQTYYFRGDNTNIYVLNATKDIIDAIIYERWTSNSRNTLATIKVVKENNSWLIDNISILSSE